MVIIVLITWIEIKRNKRCILSGQPGVVLELTQRMANTESEEIQMATEVWYGFAWKIEQEWKAPDFVSDVTSDYFDFGHVGVGDAQFQQMGICLSVMSTRRER